MSQFNFAEDQRSTIQSKSASNVTGLSGKLITAGIVKNQTQANFVLLVLMAICVGVIIFNLLSLAETSTPAILIETPAAD
jgi:hypothetical protein